MTEKKLPTGWVCTQLSDSVTPRGEKVSPSNFSGTPFLGMDHVEAHTTNIIGSVDASEMKSNAARFYDGDVLYGRLRPYLNKVARPQFDGLASAEFIVLPDSGCLYGEYLKHRLNARDFVSFASHLNEGDRPRVSFEQIGQFEVWIPPLNEQHRIVAKIEELFSELEKGVESLKAAKAQLAVYRQSVLKAAFEGRLTEGWRKEHADGLESATELLARIKAEREARFEAQLAEWQQAVADWEAAGGKVSGTRKPAKPKKPKELPPLTADELADLPELPEGWIYISLSQLGELGRGKSKHRPRNDPKLFGGEYPFIQTGEVKAANRVVREYSQTYSEFGLAQSKLWPQGTLCITIAANIAETAFLGLDCCFPDSVVGFAANESLIDSRYIELFIKAVRQRIEAYAPATAQKNINLTTLESLIVPFCSPFEQHQIVQEIESRFSVVEKMEQTIEESLQKAEALRQSILKRAFEGELVPQDPSDEPAFELLARIRAERKAAASIPGQGRKRA